MKNKNPIRHLAMTNKKSTRQPDTKSRKSTRHAAMTNKKPTRHADAHIPFPRFCTLLKELDDQEFDRLCTCMKVRHLHLRDHETFIRESDPCRWLGVVVSGAVRLSRMRMDGGRNVLETIVTNDTFGTTYVFRGAETMGLSMSAVGETQVLLFDIECIMHPCHKTCRAHLQFLRNLLTVMSQKTFQIKQKLRILSQRTIRGRLLIFLNIMAKRAKSTEFDIPFDRQALADFLCVERSALSAEISKLRAEGKLDSVRNHFALKGRPTA